MATRIPTKISQMQDLDGDSIASGNVMRVAAGGGFEAVDPAEISVGEAAVAGHSTTSDTASLALQSNVTKRKGYGDFAAYLLDTVQGIGGLYRFGHSRGTTITDLAGNGRHGIHITGWSDTTPTLGVGNMTFDHAGYALGPSALQDADGIRRNATSNQQIAVFGHPGNAGGVALAAWWNATVSNDSGSGTSQRKHARPMVTIVTFKADVSSGSDEAIIFEGAQQRGGMGVTLLGSGHGTTANRGKLRVGYRPAAGSLTSEVLPYTVEDGKWHTICQTLTHTNAGAASTRISYMIDGVYSKEYTDVDYDFTGPTVGQQFMQTPGNFGGNRPLNVTFDLVLLAERAVSMQQLAAIHNMAAWDRRNIG